MHMVLRLRNRQIAICRGATSYFSELVHEAWIAAPLISKRIKCVAVANMIKLAMVAKGDLATLKTHLLGKHASQKKAPWSSIASHRTVRQACG